MTTASHLIKKLDRLAELLCYFNSFAAFLGASVGGGAIRVRFCYDDANELPAARTKNIHIRAAFAFA